MYLNKQFFGATKPAHFLKRLSKRFCTNPKFMESNHDVSDKSELTQNPEDSNDRNIQKIENKLFSSRLLDYFLNPNRYIYFDKSDILTKFVEDNFTDIIIKPPNSGKSFSLGLLKFFLSNNITNTNTFFDNHKAFNSNITTLQRFYSQYRVITLNLQDLDANTFETNLEILRDQIVTNYEQVLPLINDHSLNSFERQQFSRSFGRLNTINPNKDILLYSLKNLSKIILRLTGKHCFLLVDDYDAPLLNASKYNFYEKMLNFLKDFFAISVKSNEYLYKTIITSTLPVEINTIFANYRNLYIHSCEDDLKYNDNYGISEEEVKRILNEDTSMNLLKSQYSSVTQENKESWTFTEVINSMKKETESVNYLKELNVKDVLIKLSNEPSEDNSNIKLLCQLCLRSLQIVNSNSNVNFISGRLLHDIQLSSFDSKVGFSLLFYNGLLRKIENGEEDNQYDIRNLSVAKHILENMPKENEFSNYQTRFILNYFLNFTYNRLDNKPNLKGFLDYLKSLSIKRVKTKADFPTFKSEKDLKNFFLKVFAFDTDYFTVINTLESPILCNLQAVVSTDGDFAIVFDCKKITRTNKPVIEDKSKLLSTSKSPSNLSSPSTIQANAFESDSEVRPEIMNELKVTTEETYKNINTSGVFNYVTSKYPVNHVFILVLSNYQKQFEYKLEVVSKAINN